MTPSASGRPKNTFSGGVGGRGVLSVSGCRVGVGVLFRGRGRGTLFEWLFPLTGFRSFESGIGCRILSTFTVNAALMLVAT